MFSNKSKTSNPLFSTEKTEGKYYVFGLLFDGNREFHFHGKETLKSSTWKFRLIRQTSCLHSISILSIEHDPALGSALHNQKRFKSNVR